MPAKNALKAKADAKAERAATAAAKQDAKDAGLTNAMKKAIRSDTLVCTKCKATKLGPVVACSCKGGVSKPGGDYDTTQDLVDAATKRHAIEKANVIKETNKQKESKAAMREKKREGLTDLANGTSESYADVSSLSLNGDSKISKNPAIDKSKSKQVKFAAGKLGMSLEGNVVNKNPEPKTQAKKLGIRCGWVINKVNDIQCPTDKAGILAIVKQQNKDGNDIVFDFRVPDDDCFNCAVCNIIQPSSGFLTEQLTDVDKGQGKQECLFCHPDPSMAEFSLY